MNNVARIITALCLLVVHCPTYTMLCRVLAKKPISCAQIHQKRAASTRMFTVSDKCLKQLKEVDNYMASFQYYYLQLFHDKKQQHKIGKNPSVLIKYNLSSQLPSDHFLSTADSCRSEFFEYSLPQIYSSIDTAFEQAYSAIEQDLIIARKRNISPAEHITLALNSPLFQLTVDQTLDDIIQQFKYSLISEDTSSDATHTIYCFPFITYCEQKSQNANE